MLIKLTFGRLNNKVGTRSIQNPLYSRNKAFYVWMKFIKCSFKKCQGAVFVANKTFKNFEIFTSLCILTDNMQHKIFLKTYNSQQSLCIVGVHYTLVQTNEQTWKSIHDKTFDNFQKYKNEWQLLNKIRLLACQLHTARLCIITF
jgi:hypothetical protein